MSRPRAYYNEHDPFAAAWLRNLIVEGLIAPGDVDERSIEDVRPDDLRGYTQCHFFAGLGGWSYALRLAGWPDDRPVWTGSCPCQPFSAAGKGAGFADERHLWPAFHWLISNRRPPVVFGEQVASKDGLAWLDLVRSDLEGTDYAGWGADLCAAGIGAPHIRQRLFWVADAASAGSFPGAHPGVRGGQEGSRSRHGEPERCGVAGRLEHTDRTRRDAGQPAAPANGHGGAAGPDGGALGLAHAAEPRWSEQPARDGRADGWASAEPGRLRDADRLGDLGRPGAHHSGWGDADWLFCADGRWRPVEPGTFPLAHGVPGRVGRLRAYGNAIVPELGAEFIRAYLEAAEAVRHGRGVGGVPAGLTRLDPELEELLS